MHRKNIVMWSVDNLTKHESAATLLLPGKPWRRAVWLPRRDPDASVASGGALKMWRAPRVELKPSSATARAAADRDGGRSWPCSLLLAMPWPRPVVAIRRLLEGGLCGIAEPARCSVAAWAGWSKSSLLADKAG